MSFKGWMLGKVNGSAGHGARPRARVAPSLHGTAMPEADAREPNIRGTSAEHEDARASMAHLGRYAPLVAAIRHELEQFVASELRLHLAIAERDRYVLASIEVDCTGTEEERDLLRRFIGEFRPEQIKQYLAREVIAGLRNASAIDLRQFAGLNAAQEGRLPEEEDPYDELLAQLQPSPAPGTVRPYEVTLVGRWAQASEPDVPPAAAVHGSRGNAGGSARPHTPLAGRTFAFDVHDAAGARRAELSSNVPGRRYVIGKDKGCDIVVDGAYASRRHCEIWFERDTWWVLDAGSTNGIRVEASGSVHRVPHAADGVPAAPLELAPGASLVLSAHADGEASNYPRLCLRATGSEDAHRAISAAPVTPIAPARCATPAWFITAEMSSGTREAEIGERALPFGIGRSRNQALVVDWMHADVSGRHVEIVDIDESGAAVVVHGENGVTVAGAHHESGAQFHWNPGERMLLGRADGDAPRCALMLSRAG